MGWIDLPAGRVETAWWGPSPDHAPTLVLLHEGLGCIALWRDVPERLAAMTGCGVFAYSRLGYGQSDPVTLPRPLTYMQDEGRDTLPLILSAAGIRNPILIGHSDGGSIATVYAGLSGAPTTPRPPITAGPSVPVTARPSPPVMAGPGPAIHALQPTTPHPAPPPTLRALITIAAHFFVEDLNIASIEQIRASYETGDLRPRLARYHRDPDIAFHGWNGAWLDPGFRSFDLTGYLPAIRVPILALQGADDPYGTDEQLRVMAAHVKAPITTVLIPNARHAPHLEAKEQTLSLIADFIRKTAA